MASLVKSFAIDGIDGYQVDIETKTLDGQPSISVIGLGDQAVKEASERVQAAITVSCFWMSLLSFRVEHSMPFGSRSRIKRSVYLE